MSQINSTVGASATHALWVDRVFALQLFSALKKAQEAIRERNHETNEATPVVEIDTLRFRQIENEADLYLAAEDIGSMILKGRFRNTAFPQRWLGFSAVHDTNTLKSIWNDLKDIGVEFYAEEWRTSLDDIPMDSTATDYRLVKIAMRKETGQTVVYPLMNNVYCEGRVVFTYNYRPDHRDARQFHATLFAEQITEHLKHVGPLTIEFIDSGGKLVPHKIVNPSHPCHTLTIAAATSYQANLELLLHHLPLGETSFQGHVGALHLYQRNVNKVDHPGLLWTEELLGGMIMHQVLITGESFDQFLEAGDALLKKVGEHTPVNMNDLRALRFV